jgi:protein TonB
MFWPARPGEPVVVNPSTRSARILALAGSFAVLALGPAPAVAEAAVTTAPKPIAITSAPKPVTRAKPEYPRRALRRGVEGSVLLEFSVDADGNVVSPRVLEARPRGVFDAAALEAVSKWKYEALGAESSALQVRLTFRDRW